MAEQGASAEELRLLREAALRFCEEEAPPGQLRALRDGNDDAGYSARVWQRMVEQGWPGVAVVPERGGAGMGQAGLGCIMECMGRTLAASPMEASAVLAISWLALSDLSEAHEIVLQSAIAGKTLLAFAHQEGDHHEAGPFRTRAVRSGNGIVLDGRKRNVWDACLADQLIVLAEMAGSDGTPLGSTALLVDARLPGVERRRVASLDSRHTGEVSFAGALLPHEAVIGPVGNAAATLERMEAIVAAQTAAQLLGIASRAFEMACDYLKVREQFGVKIGSFQALQHRAAALFVDLETSRALVRAALAALDCDAPDASLLASGAKARLCKVSRAVLNEAIQMHGGIGVTDALDLGLFLKRAIVLQQFFGDRHHHTERFARLKGY